MKPSIGKTKLPFGVGTTVLQSSHFYTISTLDLFCHLIKKDIVLKVVFRTQAPWLTLLYTPCVWFRCITKISRTRCFSRQNQVLSYNLWLLFSPKYYRSHLTNVLFNANPHESSYLNMTYSVGEILYRCQFPWKSVAIKICKKDLFKAPQRYHQDKKLMGKDLSTASVYNES